MVDKNVIELVNTKIVPEMPDAGKDITFGMIVLIAEALITLFKDCPDLLSRFQQDSGKVMDVIQNPGLFNKLRLFLIVRRQTKKDGTQLSVNTIVNAIVNAGRKASKDDVSMLCQLAHPIP